VIVIEGESHRLGLIVSKKFHPNLFPLHVANTGWRTWYEKSLYLGLADPTMSLSFGDLFHRLVHYRKDRWQCHDLAFQTWLFDGKPAVVSHCLAISGWPLVAFYRFYF
jgi:hypothetical protein